MRLTTCWLCCGALSTLLACGGGAKQNPDGGGNPDGGNGNGTVATISVSPATASVTVGKTLQFTAVAKDSNGNTVSATITWSSDDATVATVSSSGLATGIQPGTSTTIRATANTVSGAATLNVAWKPLVIPTRSLPNGTSGAAYSQAVQVSGNGGYQWNGATIAPNTTNGLVIGIDSGVLSGTPGATGLQPIFYTVNDNSGSLGIQFELSIGGTSGNNTYTNSPGPGTAGTAYDYVPTTNYLQVGCDVGGNLVFGSLPPGLSMNSLSQEVSGTPTLGGAFPVTVYGQWGSCVPPPQDGLPTDFTTFVFSIAAGPSAPPGSFWTRSGSAAAVAPGASGWDGLETGQPSLVKAGSNYFLYYDGQDSSDYHYSIGVATSTDGVTFTKSSSNPVLKPNPQPGAWDMRDVRNPVVLYDGTSYRMWYWGSDGVSTQIGFASSTDGLTWTNAPTPVSWGSSVSFGPQTIIKVGSTYTMYYPNGQLNRATSTDGQNWTDHGAVTVVGTGAFLSMEKPAVVYDGSTYRLWYSASGQLGGGLGNGGASVMVQRIAYGTSPDGINWTPLGSVFAPGAPGAWDRPAVGEPSVIKDGSVYRLAYVGGRGNFPGAGGGWFFTEGSLGIATAP